MPKRKCDEVNLTIGQRLKKYRVACELTQQEVADTLCINRTTYTKYETGISEPSHDMLQKMVNLFGTDFNAILGEEDTFERDMYDSGLPMYTLTRAERELIAGYRLLESDGRQRIDEALKEEIKKRNSNSNPNLKSE